MAAYPLLTGSTAIRIFPRIAKHTCIPVGAVAFVAGALSNPTRLRLLHALDRGELCVCQITEPAGLAPSTVSRHMAVLQAAGLVESRKDGRSVREAYAKTAGKPGETVVDLGSGGGFDVFIAARKVGPAGGEPGSSYGSGVSSAGGCLSHSRSLDIRARLNAGSTSRSRRR